MLEQAVVEKVLEKRKTGDIVLLRKMRPDACHHCNAKILCGVKSNFTFKAINHSSCYLEKGDLVEYLLPNISVIKLSFLVYSVPLLFFLMSILLMNWFFPDNEFFSAFIAIIVMFVAFFLVGWYDRKKINIGERRLPKIQQKI